MVSLPVRQLLDLPLPLPWSVLPLNDIDQSGSWEWKEAVVISSVHQSSILRSSLSTSRKASPSSAPQRPEDCLRDTYPDPLAGLDDNTPFHGGHRNNPQIEHTISTLLTLFRTRNLPIFHVKHNSRDPSSTLHPSHPGNAIFPFAMPCPSRPIDEPLYEKSVHSAFIGTSLEADLHGRGITRLFVCGFTSNMCVNTTVRMAENLGFEVFVVEDACATFDRVGPDGVLRHAEDVHAYAMSDLHGEFCTVIKSSDVRGLLGN